MPGAKVNPTAVFFGKFTICPEENMMLVNVWGTAKPTDFFIRK
jgi:hypothetical protein